jgi:hypothetical protein
MNLSATATAEVIRRQAATADELMALFPGKTLTQVVKALEYARQKGQVHRAGRVSRGLGRPATLYAPGPEPKPQREPAKRVPTCVWDLGLI